MDFTSRNAQSAPTFRPNAEGEAPGASGGNDNKKKGGNKMGNMNKWLRVGSVGLLFCVVALVVAVILLVSFQKTDSQSKFVVSGKYQAVFLNNGQVYFGKLANVTSSYFDLRDVYILQANSSNSSSSSSNSAANLSLVKLGCQQIHDPYDQMVINASQVSFWENLQANGQVVKAITQYQQQNPNGPQCTDQSQASNAQNGAQNSSNSNSTPTTNSSSSSSNSSNSTTTKP